MKKRSFVTLLLMSIFVAVQASPINIIPKPSEVKIGNGEFKLNKGVTISTNNKKILPLAKYLKEILTQSSSIDVKTKYSKTKIGNIHLKLDTDYNANNKEAYSLVVTTKGVTIVSSNNAGLFYGVQSLRQLLPASIESDEMLAINNNLAIPVVQITDAPRFGWRGYMKDVSRTFYSVDVVKKYIDIMALYKMNTLHLHLTDDQGWRIQIKSYRKLTAEKSTHFDLQYNQPSERSGSYSQKDIKDLVKYAQERNITIVPEIDVPGHSWATLLAYPELGVNNNNKPGHLFPFLESWGHWGNQFTPNSLDPTNEKVYAFLGSVFKEVVDLFPSKYIHFGGDEVMHRFWEEQPHVQKYMKENNMKNVTELQNYFVERVTKIITSLGRKPIGWNDILTDETLTKETAIMSWLGEDAITKAVNNGYYAVATPTYPLYFDITQESRHDGTMADLNYQVINSMKAIYNYDPAKGVDRDKLHLLLGVQANQWPAVPQEVKDINVQNFPRLLGVAEIGWSSKEDKDFNEFLHRLEDNKKRLDYLKVDYFKQGGYITDTWGPDDVTNEYQTKEWDVTHKVYASGRVIAAFFYTKGDNFLEVKDVELLRNGEVISDDLHYGVADYKRGIARPRTYFYNLEVEDYDNTANYSLRAKIRSKTKEIYGGKDSAGNITFNLSPYKPFTAIEKSK